MVSLKYERDGKVLFSKDGERETFIIFKEKMVAGDKITVASDVYPVFVRVKFDQAIDESLMYLTGAFEYIVPDEARLLALPEGAFQSEKHYLHVAKAYEEEKNNYRNLALNPYDMHDTKTGFPHASANAETRGEAVFYASNVINNIVANDCHGEYPYASWGIDGRKDAALTVSFGREVQVEKVVIYLRADFPHDNWWKNVTLTFSDGSVEKLDMVKTGDGQAFLMKKSGITSVTISELIMSDEPSMFPSLTALEVWGRD